MMKNTEERESFRIRREWAKKAIRDFRFRFPEFLAQLYEGQGEFFILVDAEQDQIYAMHEEFDQSIRPITCPVKLVFELDPTAIPVDEDQPYSAEIWLNGEPLSSPAMNALFHLAAPEFPGSIEFDHDIDSWIFKSEREISEEEKEHIKEHMLKLGLAGHIEIKVVYANPPKSLDLKFDSSRHSLILRGSNSYSAHSQASRHLIEQDEDLWRNFLKKRIDGVTQPAPSKPEEFSCLFDMSDCSDMQISELLTIYDRIDIIPDRRNSDWLLKHRLTVDDLMQLVALGRCRIVLPYGAEYCHPDILDGIASIDEKPPVLSRELAAKTFLSGQSKDPLLYGPFTSKQRSNVLRAIHGLDSNKALQTVLASYGQMFSGQHQSFMLNGAMASMGCGIGVHLGELIAASKGIDARLELSLAGAGVEWAMALGSSWIPRTFGKGYDETNNSLLVASFISRTAVAPADPVTSRLHTLTNGLLAVKDVPPLEIARNFNGDSITRFRTLSRRLMHQAPTQEEMLECIEQINQETRRFERRIERLTEWRMEALAAAVAAKPIGDAIDTTLGGGFASVLTFWLLEGLKNHIPSSFMKPLGDIREVLLGIALAPSMDAVVVSRARSSLNQQSRP